jgi:membrane glycosyltransferase
MVSLTEDRCSECPRLHQQFLPAESPLPMSRQRLQTFQRSRPEEKTARYMQLRRALIFFNTAALTSAGCYEMYEVVQVGGVTVLEWIVLILFVTLFAWIAFSFSSALAGFAVLLFACRDPLGIDPAAPLPSVASRNAMLLPTYNEDPHRVMARLRAMHESVYQSGFSGNFDWFVLSDTTDSAIWIAEEKLFLQLRKNSNTTNVYYRHRRDNIAKKSGNIEDWIKRFGSAYDHMITLDADSLMTGDTIVRLASAMESHPTVALIQTLPIIVNARTLFARLQQYSGRLYGPLMAAGVAWWHGSEGNYWGHNAIIRVAAFARDAGLPALKGRKPFGGHILSHDFVEAALMRRAGWTIRMVPALGGSFEECPPSLLDFAARDRRWCQGNLQHVAVLRARGLHWVSRLHLLTGIGSYLTAPLWLLFLVLGIMISLQAHFVRPEYFPKGFSLFPKWPAQDPVLAAWVFVGTMGLLIAPKLLACILVGMNTRIRRQFGGGLRILVSILIEILLSGLIAPVMMIFQSTAVGAILLGRDAGWQVQRRDDGVLPRSELIRRYTLPTLFGIAMTVIGYAVSLPLLFWMAPVIAGLLLCIPIALLSSAVFPQRGLLITPEHTAPPDVLVRANELATNNPRQDFVPALVELRNDRELLEHHLATLPDEKLRTRGRIDPHLAIARAKIEDIDDFDGLLSYLTAPETLAALNSPTALRAILALPRAGQAVLR